MEHLSLQQARAIVDHIRVKNGGLSREARETLPEEALEAIENLGAMAGASIVHVAEDLYDVDTRFIFELIQNAEDNHYDHAVEEPFLHFTIHNDHITVDSNEDGFSENDVRAICNIHRSTKKQIGGYIGHKGIGFKSVFKVASKVTIQSGPFCFSFEHHQGDSGLGMITPFSQTPQDLPAGVNTRITLFLISPRDFESRASELSEIPDTLLLFLRKLRRLTLENVPLQSRTSYKRHEDTSNRLIILIKQTNGDEQKKFYHLEKATLSDLPEHHSRPTQCETDLILAFPVDMAFNPLIEAQYVYSFLPMRREGFNFLIQSDFITQANRQGIHQCPRNYAIRESVSSLFVQAVRYFCEHTALKYEWLQYLPGAHIHDRFWADLRDMIFDALKESQVLISRKGTLKYPKELQRLSPRHCDRHGQPLLADIDPEIYLSQTYDWSRHAENLTELGVTNLSYQNIINRLAPYLESPSPKFLDPILDDDWHTRVADLLLRALKRDGSRAITEQIKKMALIPTLNGSLSSAWSSPVFFSDDERGNLIPEGLEDIQIVQRNVLESPSRRALLEALGVTHCEPDRVVKSILKKYNKYRGVALKSSVSHLSYLFRTLGKEESLDKRIFIMDQNEKRIYRAFVPFGAEIIHDDLYFETLGEYGTKELAQNLQSGFNQQSSSCEMHIIHSAYINAMPPSAISSGRTWEQWLEEVALVRYIPRLKSSRADQLSTLCQYLADHHPMTLMGVLKTYLSSYQAELTPGIIKVLKRISVPCRNQKTDYLCKTYYPSKEMQQLCSDATVEENFHCFLDIPTKLATDDTHGWEFLATLGVGLQPDVRFFEVIFRWLEAKATPRIQTQTGFFKMYKELSIRFPEASNELNEVIFEDYVAVCIPGPSGESLKRVYLSDCVWRGHHGLQTKHPLAIHPEFCNNPHVAFLFKDILRLPDAGLDTYIEELQWRKDNSDVSMDGLRAVYEIISREIQTSENSSLVLREFSERKLLYLPTERAWLAPESCVWADAPKIGAQYGISTVYPELEDFFRGSLKVHTPTAANYIEQLRRLVSESPVDISEVKAAIYKVNALGPGSAELHGLSHMRFLPVTMPSGNVEVLKPTDTFFIADRVEYLAAFRNKVPILNFSLEEGRRLHRILGFLDLEDRYMSTAVQEQTIVDQPSHEPSSRETRTFRKKARHIYRCILHYNTESLEADCGRLRQLQNSVVYESGTFQKTLVLQLNEVTARVQSDTGLVHIEDNSDEMRIYIPRNPSDRQRCYSMDLPKALVLFFGLRDLAASLTLQLVFLSPESLIGQVLDGNGIIRISPDVFEQSGTNSEDLSSAEEDSFTEGHPFPRSEETEVIEERMYTPQISSENLVELQRTIVTHHGSSSLPPRPLTVSSSSRASLDRGSVSSPEESPYVQLLDRVIRLARQLTIFEALQRPMNNVWDNGNVAHELVFGVRSENKLAHDIKIGAAGELFVFELLLTQGLPGFNRATWRSNIRKNVSVHPEYHDLTHWNGPETADLVYPDTSSALTSILIDSGYLPHARWHGANPTYYIEVKTTTGECDSAFFMSKSQYRRMQRMRIEPTEQANPEIYIIFRVYHLGKDGMSLKIYVDPESLRQEQRLLFAPDSYSVSPSQR